MKHLIEQFILGHARSAWIVNEHFKMYVRKSRRINKDTKTIVSCFDIANMVAVNPGHGYWAKVYDELVPLARLYGFECLYAENVHNKALRSWFVRKGFNPELAVNYELEWTAMLSLKE